MLTGALETVCSLARETGLLKPGQEWRLETGGFPVGPVTGMFDIFDLTVQWVTPLNYLKNVIKSYMKRLWGFLIKAGAGMATKAQQAFHLLWNVKHNLPPECPAQDTPGSLLMPAVYKVSTIRRRASRQIFPGLQALIPLV